MAYSGNDGAAPAARVVECEGSSGAPYAIDDVDVHCKLLALRDVVYGQRASRMKVYARYANRDRVALGVRVKKLQALRMFQLARAYADVNCTSVLEIGPGDGYIAQLSRDHGMRYLAVESSNVISDHLKKQGHEVINASVPPLPSQLGTFECCFMLHVIEHMRDFREAAALVEQLWHKLNPGGVLIVACPDFVRWGYRFYDCDYTHGTPFTRRRLITLLEEHGFEVRLSTIYTGSVFGYRGLPIGWLARLLYPAFIDDLVGRRFPRDVANRGMLTLLPSLLAIAAKPGLTTA